MPLFLSEISNRSAVLGIFGAAVSSEKLFPPSPYRRTKTDDENADGGDSTWVQQQTTSVVLQLQATVTTTTKTTGKADKTRSPTAVTTAVPVITIWGAEEQAAAQVPGDAV